MNETQRNGNQIPDVIAARLQFGQILNHTMLRHLLPKRTQQHLNPLSLGGDAVRTLTCQVDPKLSRWKYDQTPKILSFSDDTHLMVKTGWNMEREYFVYLIIDSYCLFVLDESSRKSRSYREACTSRFLHSAREKSSSGQQHRKKSSSLNCFGGSPLIEKLHQAYDEPTQLMVYLAGFTPSDIESIWFPSMAAALMHTQVTISIQNKAGITRAASPSSTTFSFEKAVGGLTALLLTMKAHLNLLAMARVFSYAPSQIAQEIRVFDLAPALGTHATRYLLACIFEELKANAYRTDQPDLISAATHLLVAHIGRQDHQVLLMQAIPGQRALVAKRLMDLIDVQYHADPSQDFATYAKMAALRDGIIYGAMRAYAADLDAHNQASVESLKMFAASVTSLSSIAADLAPEGGAVAAAAVQAAGNVASLRLDRWFGNRWVAGELDKAIAARFDLEITAPANAGSIPRMEVGGSTTDEGGGGQLEGAEGGGQQKGEQEAGQPKKTSDADLAIIKDVYLVNVGFVMAFAMYGTVKTRVSLLPTRSLQRGRRRV